MIHQTIYETLGNSLEDVAELIGSDALTVALRREKIQTFLEDHEWDEDTYIAWQKTQRPTYAQMAKNAARAIVDHAVNKWTELDGVAVHERILLCSACDYIRADERCSLCGCMMKIKAKWAEQKCPINKW